MSDYLQRLVQRHFGAATQVVPNANPFFSPGAEIAATATDDLSFDVAADPIAAPVHVAPRGTLPRAAEPQALHAPAPQTSRHHTEVPTQSEPNPAVRTATNAVAAPIVTHTENDSRADIAPRYAQPSAERTVGAVQLESSSPFHENSSPGVVPAQAGIRRLETKPPGLRLRGDDGDQQGSPDGAKRNPGMRRALPDVGPARADVRATTTTSTNTAPPAPLARAAAQGSPDGAHRNPGMHGALPDSGPARAYIRATTTAAAESLAPSAATVAAPAPRAADSLDARFEADAIADDENAVAHASPPRRTRVVESEAAAPPPLLPIAASLPPSPTPVETPTRVTVSIGTVEIRAAPPVATTPVAPARAAPRLSLDDYLRRRNGGTP